jgi:hypothetical protein
MPRSATAIAQEAVDRLVKAGGSMIGTDRPADLPFFRRSVIPRALAWKLHVAMCEQARDEDATARLHLDEVRPSAERLVLLARPLTEYMAELVDDQRSGDPQYPAEWANLMGLLYGLAGAVGLLDLAEDKSMPRILEELTGPLSRAQDVVAIQRRLAGSRTALPPGPGEASVTMVRNTLA